MRIMFARAAHATAVVALVFGLTSGAAMAEKLRIALSEPPSDELAHIFVALDRAKKMGLEYEWTAFADEELAIQAILSGQMDIGFGTPYSVMQRSKAPVRIIFQMSKLKFFPVTSKKYAKLEDLDGEPIMLHSRGGGTDSIANVIEDRVGIKFGKRSYVPGSSNRVAALMAGQTDATIVDLSNKNKLMKLQGDKFNVLPMFEVDASDEALFANLDWMKKNSESVASSSRRWSACIGTCTRIRRWSNARRIRTAPLASSRKRCWMGSTVSSRRRSRADFTIRTAAA